MKIDEARYDSGWLMLKTVDPDARKFAYKFAAGEYDISPAKKKRSLNANDFCWALCTEIADVVGETKEDIYRDAIKHVGIYKDFHSISPSEAPTFQKAWGMLGTGWVTEQVDYEPDGEKVVIRAYYGSSQYNVRQMSRLIDWLKREAENLDIEVDNGRIRSLLDDWADKERG